MADLSMPWGGDLTVDETGDYVCVDGVEELQERLIRRYLTNNTEVINGAVATPGDYVFEPSYGGNARRYVDSVSNSATLGAIKNLILQQTQQEAGVSKTIAPVVSVTQIANGIFVDVTVATDDGQVALIPQLEVTQD